MYGWDGDFFPGDRVSYRGGRIGYVVKDPELYPELTDLLTTTYLWEVPVTFVGSDYISIIHCQELTKAEK